MERWMDCQMVEQMVLGCPKVQWRVALMVQCSQKEPHLAPWTGRMMSEKEQEVKHQ